MARQTYPRVELVLVLHGDGFGGVEQQLADLPMPSTALRLDPGQPLGAALNSAAAAAGGAFLAKMDDDDAYGREHLWDLVLAQEYAQAQLVMKADGVRLSGRVGHGRSAAPWYMSRGTAISGAGGTLLVPREIFDRVGGFPYVPKGCGPASCAEKIRQNGGQAYRTHGAGFVLVRHGKDHTWDVEDAWFLDRAFAAWPGREPGPGPHRGHGRLLHALAVGKAAVTTTATQHDPPPPQRVRYNDWRQVTVPSPGAFVPTLPVSVIVPYYAQPGELERTLAALEGQTYPRNMFEVVVVDDGSPEPLARPRATPLNVKVVRQEDLGFGLARARNTGVRTASHEVLLFLDADMLPEASWLAAHARWHHALPDAVTLGFRLHVPVDGMDPGTIRSRPGTLKALFKGQDADSTETPLDRILHAQDRRPDVESGWLVRAW